MVATDTRTTPPAPAPTAARLTVFQRLAGFSARRRWWVIGAWLIVTAVSAPLAATVSGALSGAGWEAQGSTAEQVRNELRRDFAALGAEDAMVVYTQRQPVAMMIRAAARKIRYSRKMYSFVFG